MIRLKANLKTSLSKKKQYSRNIISLVVSSRVLDGGSGGGVECGQRWRAGGRCRRIGEKENPL